MQCCRAIKGCSITVKQKTALCQGKGRGLKFHLMLYPVSSLRIQLKYAAQINLGSKKKISRGNFPRLTFSCPVPSGLPHRSHCVPMNMNRVVTGSSLVRPTGFEPAAFRVGIIRPANWKALQGNGLVGIAQISAILRKNLESLAGQDFQGFSR